MWFALLLPTLLPAQPLKKQELQVSFLGSSFGPHFTHFSSHFSKFVLVIELSFSFPHLDFYLDVKSNSVLSSLSAVLYWRMWISSLPRTLNIISAHHRLVSAWLLVMCNHRYTPPLSRIDFFWVADHFPQNYIYKRGKQTSRLWALPACPAPLLHFV